MFEFDAGKLLVIGVVALIVIGPKDLPRVLRQAGQAMAKLRRMASEFQGQFMDAMREAELDDIRKGIDEVRDQTRIQNAFNPIQTVRRELTDALSDAKPRSEVGAPNLAMDGLVGAGAAEGPGYGAAAIAPVAEPEGASPESAPALIESTVIAEATAPVVETVDVSTGRPAPGAAHS
jgi:sec-independent protein translocase protein TatB